MRAIWSGEISFGLVNVPVKLYSATRSHDLSFHQVHDEDHGRIRYQRTCEVCGQQIDYEHIEKAYDDGDRTVILTDEELAALPSEDRHEIAIVQFVPQDQIEPLLLGSSYLLEPVGRSAKAYVLLRHTLQESERTAVVTFTLRSKTRLGVLRVHEDLLALQTLQWPQELQEVDFGPKNSKIAAKEQQMAAALVEQFAGDFDPELYSDEYQEELRELVDAKFEQGDAIDTEVTFGRTPEEAEEKEGEGGKSGKSGKSGKVVSLMDALERSLSTTKGSGGSASSNTSSSGSSEKSSGTAKKKSGGKKSA